MATSKSSLLPVDNKLDVISITSGLQKGRYKYWGEGRVTEDASEMRNLSDTVVGSFEHSGQSLSGGV